MNGHHSSGSLDGELDQVMEIISALARKSASAKYIYRGEPKSYNKVSSGLYRENQNELDIEAIQQNDLYEAKTYTQEADEFAILTEIQHYGGKTNLIDFTKDYLIALFFACDGYHTHDGRVIFLKLDGDMRDYVREPQNSARRVLAQKSVFVRPPAGYIEPDDKVIIPYHLKARILKYLQDSHDIFFATIYNDLLGFIRSRSIHREASAHLATALAHISEGRYPAAIEECDRSLDRNPQMAAAYHARGVARLHSENAEKAIADFNRAIELVPRYAASFHSRGIAYLRMGNYDRAIEDFDRDLALNDAVDYGGSAVSDDSEGYGGRAIEGLDLASQLNSDPATTYRSLGLVHVNKGDYNRAIEIYNRAIELMPDDAGFYADLGQAWLHLSDWTRAKEKLMTAREMGADIATSFHNNYDNVADFQQKTGLTAPDDIAEMLGG